MLTVEFWLQLVNLQMKINMRKFFFITIILSVFIACAEKPSANKIIVLKNTLEIPRNYETIEISKSFLGFSEEENFGIII